MDIPSLMQTPVEFVFVIVVFLIAISIIVAIHEYGHYIVGRWCGIHAEVFSIGFGKVLAARTDKRGTQWQIAALPLGGYVKFLGDANAASVGGTAQVAGFAPRNTMLGAPLWARALTVLAGPVFNFILAVLIFAGATMWQGKSADELVLRANYDLPPQFINELQPGDRIIAVEDMVFGTPEVDVDTLPDQPAFDYTIERDGNRLVVQGPHPIVPRVDALAPRSAADDARIRVGDVVTAVDGQAVYAFNDLVDAVQDKQGTPLSLTLWRDGDLREVELTPRTTDDLNADGEFEQVYRIGIIGTFFFAPATDSVGPLEALGLGFDRLLFTISTSLNGLWNILTGGISTCNLSGPVGMAQATASMASQGVGSYVIFIGFISAAIGLLNLFPIPILDGGHLVFHAYEAVTRRKPSDRAMQVLMAGGLALIGTLMVFTLFNDLIFCP